MINGRVQKKIFLFSMEKILEKRKMPELFKIYQAIMIKFLVEKEK
jgi:hypothetical protein